MNQCDFVHEVIEEMTHFDVEYRQMNSIDPLRYPAEMTRLQWECELFAWWRKRAANA